MGLMDHLLAGPRIEQNKMALIGKYLFENKLDNEHRKSVVALANQRLREGRGGYPGTIDEVDKKVRYLFLALCMQQLGIDHGLKGFQWLYVRNPFSLEVHDDRSWRLASKILADKHGLLVSIDDPELFTDKYAG